MFWTWIAIFLLPWGLANIILSFNLHKGLGIFWILKLHGPIIFKVAIRWKYAISVLHMLLVSALEHLRLATSFWQNRLCVSVCTLKATVSSFCLCMYYFDMIFRKDVHIDHSDGYFVRPLYHDWVLDLEIWRLGDFGDFRFGAFSLNTLFKVPWSLLLKVVLPFSGVTILSQTGEMVINQGP